jgi:alkylhydroperoxidase family enzyme
MLLHSPPIAAGWNALLGAVRQHTLLPPRVLELVICAVAALNGAEYEWAHHAPLLLAAGGTEAQLAALRALACAGAPPGAAAAAAAPDRVGDGGGGDSGGEGEEQPFSAAERAALALAFEMTRGVAVADGTFDAARRELGGGDRVALELVAAVAAYNMVSRLLVATGVGPEREGAGAAAAAASAQPSGGAAR